MKIDRHRHRRGLGGLEDAATIPPPWLHPLAGAKWSHYRELISRHRTVPPRSRFQRLFLAFALLQRTPLAWIEARLEALRDRLSCATPEPGRPPLFLIGHWGSGTTWLHQILSLDSQFGYPDVGDTLMPWNLNETSRYCRAFVRPALPRDRLFDAVGVCLEDPQEEEVALAAMGPVSYFLSLYFPSETEGHLCRALFPERAAAEEREAFEEAYRLFHQRIRRKCSGRRILFKNPASTTRIAMLRRLFPGAQFVHLVRNPFEVYAAAINRIPYLLNGFALEDFRHLSLERLVLETYESLMRRYLEDRALLPPEDLVEVRFEELEQDRPAVISRIYKQLGIDGAERVIDAVRAKEESEPPYRRTSRPLAPEVAARVAQAWRFAFDAWGYAGSTE